MKNLKIYIIAALALGTSAAAFAQSPQLDRAREKQDRLAYMDAIEEYEVIVAKSKADSSAVAKPLAECYLAVRNMEKAEEWYALAIDDTAEANDLYNYAQTLEANKKYGEADQYMDKFNAARSNDRRAKDHEKYNTSLEVIKKEQSGVTISRAPFNSPNSDFGVAWFGEDIIFASARDEGVGVKSKYGWNDEPFLDLYTGFHTGTGSILKLTSLSGDINTNLHEATCVQADEETIYFTRNNMVSGKQKKNEQGLTNLKLYKATLVAGEWTNIEDFPYNSDDYSVGHPAISADGKTIYFTSNMAGGFGGKDIYMCKMSAAGEWEQPINMGAKVNTEGDEMFPFVDAKNNLYFSSDGKWGLGGLDIFKGKMSADSKVSDVRNMGAPLNSNMDDFSFIVNKTGEEGYLSSNREGSESDDIYFFTMTPEVEEEELETPEVYTLAGKVVDAENDQALAGAQAVLFDQTNTEVAKATVKEDGIFSFDLPTNAKGYYVKVQNGAMWTEANSTPIGAETMSASINLGNLALDQQAEETVAEDTAEVVEETPVEVAPNEAIQVSLTNEKTGETNKKETDANGEVNFTLDEFTAYNVKLEKEGFFTKTDEFETKEVTAETTLGDFVEVAVEKIEVGKSIKIENINYDYNKDNIRPDAAVELDKIVKLLNDNPGVSIELGSHTDARGSSSYNQQLSERRAKSAVEYIRKNGIDTKRVTYKGYGETAIINKCADGIKCSDEDHEVNRRTEFKVTEVAK